IWDGLCPSVADAADQRDLRDGLVKSAFVLTLATDWESMKAQLNRNIKESLRKCYNSLRRDGLECSLEVVDDPDGIERGLADFFRLHAERAARTDTIHHANVFGSAEARAFLLDVCRRFALRGVARLFRLRIDGQVVAVRVGFRMGQQLYLYY